MGASMHTLVAAGPVLAAADLTPGPGGYAYGPLAAAATVRGWQVRTEERSLVAPRLRWRAMVLAPVPGGAGHRTVGGTHGQGATEEGALAVALARMLIRAERPSGEGRAPAPPSRPASAPPTETDGPAAPRPASGVPSAADQAAANQERDLASGEENAS